MLTEQQYKRLIERFVKQFRPLVNPSLPLYEPNPGDDDKQVRIGDVGVILRGGFLRKFSVVVDKNHPIEPLDGCPNDYEPITFNPDTDVDTKVTTSAEGVIWCSKGLSWKKVDADPGYVRYQFQKDTKDAMFAVVSPEIVQMSLKEEKLERWKTYMEANMNHWIEFAEQKSSIIRAKFKPEDFILVRGCVKTSQWIRATFEGTGEFTLEIDLQDWYYGSTLRHGKEDISDDWLMGATSENSIHCLSLQGLRYEREGFWAPKKIVAGAEPRDPSRDDGDWLDEPIQVDTPCAVGPEHSKLRYEGTKDGKQCVRNYAHGEFASFADRIINAPSYLPCSSSIQTSGPMPIPPTQLSRTLYLPARHAMPSTVRTC